MKIIVPKEIESRFLGERYVETISNEVFEPESSDGMRREFVYDAEFMYFSDLQNPQKNRDGSYTYDYEYKVIKPTRDTRKFDPEHSSWDLNKMVETLLFKYNVHEFKTDVGEKKEYSIKDYFITADVSAIYNKGKDAWFNYPARYTDDAKSNGRYYEVDDPQWKTTEKNQARIKSTSIDDLTHQLSTLLTRDDLLLYMLGQRIEKKAQIKLGYDDIKPYENTNLYLSRVHLPNIPYLTLEEAMEKENYTLEDLERLVRENQRLDASQVPVDILNQLLEKDDSLYTHFSETSIPVDIRRKYNPNFNILDLNPSELLPCDLDKLLEKLKDRFLLDDLPYQKRNETFASYMLYFQSFIEDISALKKIIPAIACSSHSRIYESAHDFFSKISPEVLAPSEIRDIVLQENIGINRVMLYEFEYDEDSAHRLLELLSVPKQQVSLEELNKSIEIMKQNGIENEDILQALRKNGFNIILRYNIPEEEIKRFRSFGIDGITFDDLQEQIEREKSFKIMKLAPSRPAEDFSRGFNNIIKALEEKRANNTYSQYDILFEFMTTIEYSYEILSRLTPEVREKTKRCIIDNIDRIECLQKDPLSSKFSKLMNSLAEGFDLSDEDLINIYAKCLNNCADKKSIIGAMKPYISEERRALFEKRVDAAKIYPNPKFDWYKAKKYREFRIEDRYMDKDTIKREIRLDNKKECFNKIMTDRYGEMDGKKIKVDNMSKWLFGVPKARGFLILKDGDCIVLPQNTPDEAVKLIERIINGKTHEKPY